MAGHKSHHSAPPKEETKEYEDLLKMSSSVITGIQKQMQNWADTTKHLGKNQREYVEKLKAGVGELTDQESINKHINKLNDVRSQLLKNQKVHQSSFNQIGISNLKIITEALQLEFKRQVAIEGVQNASEHLASTLNDTFDGIESGLHHIPLIGGILSSIAKGPVEKLKESVTSAAGAFTKKFGESLKAGAGSFNSLKAAGSEAFSGIMAAMNPVTLAIIGIGAAITMAFLRFHELETAADDFKEQTGLAVADAHELEHSIQMVSNKMGYLGASAADVSKAMSDFTKEFDNMTIPMESTVESMVMLNKNFGIATDTASEVNKIMQNMAGLSETQAQYLTNSVVEMSNLAGVAPQSVMKDISDSAEESYKYFKGDAKELAKAAVQAAKMGTSLTNIMKTSEKLLDFEQSVTDELEFSALAGKDINLGKARELAFLGDEIGMQKELGNQLAKIGDINSLSVYEKQKLMDLTGQDLKTLTNTQRIASKFGDLDKERLAAANALLGKGLDIKDIGESELEDQANRLKKQEQMQDMMDQIGNRMSQMGTAFMDMFAPIGGVIIKTLMFAVKAISGILIPAFQMLGKAIYIATLPIQSLLHGFEVAIEYIKKYIDYVAAAGVGMALVVAWQEKSNIQSALSNGYEAVKAAFQKDGLIYNIATEASKKAQAAWDLLSAGYAATKAAIEEKGLLRGIAAMAIKAFNSLADIPVVGWALGAAAAVGAYALGKSYMSKAGDVYSPADGKTQISTKEGGLFELSKNDDVLAGPGLGEQMKNQNAQSGIVATNGEGGGGNSAIAGLVNSMISEIQGLRTDLTSGKVAVYMDGQLVTSKVAGVAANNPVTGR